VVGDRGGVGVALELIARGDRRADLFARLLHARGAVRQPVDIDEAVVLAAIGLAGGDRRRERDRGVGGGVGIAFVGTTGDDGVIFLVGAGWRRGPPTRR